MCGVTHALGETVSGNYLKTDTATERQQNFTRIVFRICVVVERRRHVYTKHHPHRREYNTWLSPCARTTQRKPATRGVETLLFAREGALLIPVPA